MPTYEYQCLACYDRFEEIQSITADTLTICPSCGEPKLVRLISGGAAVFVPGTKTPTRIVSDPKTVAKSPSTDVRPTTKPKPKKNVEIPWWRSSADGAVRKDILKNPERYIQEGEV